MMYRSVHNFKRVLNRYLEKNNLTFNDIKSYGFYDEFGTAFVVVYLNNGKVVKFKVDNEKNNSINENVAQKKAKYKLTKKGQKFLGTTVALVGVMGISSLFGNFLYHKDDNGEISLSSAPIESELIVEDLGVSNDTFIQLDNQYEDLTNYIDESYLNLNNDFQNNTALNNVVQNNVVHREVNIHGNLAPTITSYNDILNKFYEPINTYGNRYGIDPAIIAALLMQESGSDDSEEYQTNYEAQGLGKFNCNYFDNVNYHVYNFETNQYEDYVCKYDKLVNNRDEQIKIIAMTLQRNAVNYHGNLAGILITYNIGDPSFNKVLKNAVDNTNIGSKSDLLDYDDVTVISNNNNLKMGDPQYFDKLTTFLSFILKNEEFGRNYAQVNLPNGDIYQYTVNLELTNLKGAR